MDPYSSASGVSDAAALGFTSLTSLFCCGLYIIPIVIGLLLTVFWIYMLIQVLVRDEKSFSDSNGKVLWVVVILIGGFIGAVIYYFVEHRKYKGKNP